ncbi:MULTISPECIES: hypothetical protein [unclassified Streptomyces]|uniref:hypothetical protein n=1 Tax=unclassified Streptomyces TaxID=2593676 RepID=UPI0033D7EDB5
MATEAQPDLTKQPADNITQPSRADRARAAFKEQCGHAGARMKDWLAAGDLDEVAVIHMATEAKQRKHAERIATQERLAAQAHAHFAVAKARSEQDGATMGAGKLATLAGEVAATESRLEALRAQVVLPPNDREIDRARHSKRAGRAAIIAGGGFTALPVFGVTVEQAASGQPLLLAALGAAAGYGWYLVSRPFTARQDGGAPFGMPPASLPATFLADPTQAGVTSVGSIVVMNVEQLADGARPFPLRNARTPEQLAECVLLAARAENVPVVEVSDVQRQPWGWQCVVRVGEGTPEAIIEKSGDLETKFDLPTNGVRPQPLKARRACAILRLVAGDPFATAPGLPYRAPKSLSITDRFRIGTSVGGDPLELSLAGVMGLWVAASGGGKTGILQALAEGTTACRDNITIDLDPHGDGLEDLGDAVRITARTNEQIEAVLLFFLVMSKARARLRAKLGMGKKWKASPEHPAVTIFFDEFPKATELAKRLAFDLLLVGRKELIEVEIASQGGQKNYLGENFAQMVALKAVGPCKVGDTRAVFGDGSVREGYLPHKLSPATDTDPKDAGHIFIQGVPGKSDEPIEYAIHEVPSATLRKLAEERLEAGLLDPDQDSLDGMRNVDLPEYVEPEYDKDDNIKKPAPVELLTWEQLLRLCDAVPPAGTLADTSTALIADAVDLMDKTGVDRMRSETLTAALIDFNPDAYGDLTPDGLKVLLREAGAGGPVSLGPLDELVNPRGFKREALARLL